MDETHIFVISFALAALILAYILFRVMKVLLKGLEFVLEKLMRWFYFKFINKKRKDVK